MKSPLTQADHDALDAYCDGRLDAAARSAFEARIEREPSLREALECQRSIDAALGRLFTPPAVPRLDRAAARTDTLKLRPNARYIPWRPLATAAAILLMVGGGWWQWQRMQELPGTALPKQTLFANYQSEVASGFKVAGKCWGDKEFALVFFDKLSLAITVLPPPAGVELLGIDYSNTLSLQTTMLMARVNGQPVIAYVDRKERDKAPTTAPASGCDALHVFRHELQDVVIYEISPFDRAYLVDLFKQIEMKPEWYEEWQKSGTPY